VIQVSSASNAKSTNQEAGAFNLHDLDGLFTPSYNKQAKRQVVSKLNARKIIRTLTNFKRVY
jgi:hypothetical protein